MKLNFRMTPIMLGMTISVGINLPILLVEQYKSTAQEVIKSRRQPPVSPSRGYPKKRNPAVSIQKKLPNSPSRGYPKERKAAISER
jgi:hypothetical protein